MLNIRIENKALLMSNLPLTVARETAKIITDSAASSGTISVDSIAGFSVGKYILLGNFGDSNAEIIRIHAATAPTGTTITLATNTVYDHYADTPVTLIDYNQVEFSRAATLTGSKTVLNGTSAVDIQASKTETIYVPVTGDSLSSSVYVFARFKNSSDTVYSDYTTGVLYGSLSATSVSKLAERATADTGTTVGGEYSTETMILNDVNEAIEEITKYDWIFELIKDESSLTAATDTDTYALSGLTYDVKYSGTAQGIKSVKFLNTPLEYVEYDDMEDLQKEYVSNTISTQITAGDTTVTLTNSYEFAESGTATVGGVTFTYTANAQSTGILSGISASTFTTTIAAGTNVWQGVEPGLPTKYTIFDGDLILDKPVASDYAGYKIRISYLKQVDAMTDFLSTLTIPFTNEIVNYIKYKIEERKRNAELSNTYLAKFNAGIEAQRGKYKLPLMEEYTYYNF